MKKFLTKTIFKNSLNCPTAVYYSSKKDEYINIDDSNEFLKALCEGGYQIEYLAKDYYPQGIDMKKLSFEENVNETQRLLSENENIVLFEPIFIYENFLARVDILEKKGNEITIIEVKAASFDFSTVYDKKTGEPKPLYKTLLNSRSKKAQLTKSWEEYVYDVAYQKYILLNTLNNYTIKSCLFLLDKNESVTVNGLHQKYLIKSDNSVEIKDGDVGNIIMKKLYLDTVFDEIDLFDKKTQFKEYDNFKTYLDVINESYTNSSKIKTTIGSKCSSCPFYSKEIKNDKKSGYIECWTEQTEKDADFIVNNSTVLDIWNYRNKDAAINEKIFFAKDLYNSEELKNKLFETKDDENVEKNIDFFDTKGRQITQIEKVIDNDNDIKVYKNALKTEMNNWIYPLNMIDFETTAVAIPFNIHLKPYETIAYQYSHHVIYEDGRIEHFSDFLHTKQGEFPSFEFIRSLKNSLEQNNGSIFMYSPHENSVLNHILRQLYSKLGENETDRFELIDFIKNITVSNERTINELSQYSGNPILGWSGNRALIDLWDILKKYYYNPHTKGSNSIKYVLPAILKSSKYLQKYKEPIYGTDIIKSKNFKNVSWVQYDDKGEIINPYKLLPILYKEDDNIYSSKTVANGGEAMISYAKLQFTQMTENERNELIKSMLRYCELDTLGMVFIYEHWKYDI